VRDPEGKCRQPFSGRRASRLTPRAHLPAARLTAAILAGDHRHARVCALLAVGVVRALPAGEDWREVWGASWCASTRTERAARLARCLAWRAGRGPDGGRRSSRVGHPARQPPGPGSGRQPDSGHGHARWGRAHREPHRLSGDRLLAYLACGHDTRPCSDPGRIARTHYFAPDGRALGQRRVAWAWSLTGGPRAFGASCLADRHHGLPSSTR
jgi:hypothetical protein